MAAEDSTYQRMLQTLAVVLMIFTQVFLFLIMPTLLCYIIFATKYWWICVLYYTWCFVFDKDADVIDKWRFKWVRSWSWWAYAKNYYPLKVVKLPWGELDRKRNYLFCYFPHGMLSPGSYFTLATNATEFQEYFPHHQCHIFTAGIFYKLPILREIGLWVGGKTASKEALQNILGREGGGKIAGLVVGGAKEAYFCKPGVYKILYKNRKGFIKIALSNGAPLVPIYTFGENELFSQAELDEDSILQKLREVVRRTVGLSVIIPVGRKDMLGLVPHRRPLTVVVGEPIDVQKTENPTQEQIDNLHQLFLTKLVELFESQKKFYLKDYETAHLEIC